MNDNTLKGNKKAIIGTAIGIVSMLIIIVGATYAYWNAREAVNFNTSTITYETRENSLIVLNGTSALLTLGTITGPDMKWSPNDVVYYAGEEDKTKTPTEVTVGIATYGNINDINTYRCQYTLTLTHSGTNDIIDKFLSENYTNRSEGQIILTVNGEEYDLNDGFPSTITGYLNVFKNQDAPINVGLKFVNLSDVDQDYLINTNGYININVASNDFTCGIEEARVVYMAPGYSTDENSQYDSSETYPGLAQVSDYHDIHYSYIVDSNSEKVDMMYFNHFDTLSECETALSYTFLDVYSFDFCDYQNDKYFMNSSTNTSHTSYESLGITFESQIPNSDLFFYQEDDCEDALNIVENDSNFVTYSRESLPSNLSCLTVYQDMFIKETTTPTIASDDIWAIRYDVYNSIYSTQSDCMNAWYRSFNSTTRYYSYLGEPCVRINDNQYQLESLILNFDVNNSISGNESFNESIFSVKKFASESDCLDYIDDYVDSNTYSSATCIHIREEGKLYREITSEICISNNSSLKCLPVEEDSFWNVDNITSEIEDMGYSCEYSNVGNAYYCENGQNEGITEFRFSLHNYSGYFVNAIYVRGIHYGYGEEIRYNDDYQFQSMFSRSLYSTY